MRKSTIIVAIIIFLTILLVPFLNSDKYAESIELGGEWFLNSQNDKFLFYTYDFEKNTYSGESHALRETASLWSISKLANYLNDPRYKTLANKGFNHFETYFYYDQENDFLILNITKRQKLGYSAFMVLTLLESEHPQKQYYLEKFSNGILHQQNEDGSLSSYFYSSDPGNQNYYPGEALFAIMSMYEQTGEIKYLQATQRAFPFYKDYFQEEQNTAFVPWQSRAYNKLYKVTQDQEVADFVFEMNDFMVDFHNPGENCQNFDFSRGSVTAVYMEGVNMAYELARLLNDQERVTCYSNFIEEGADAILALQITDKKNYPLSAIGGIRGSWDSTEMRVDRNQHAVLALMEAKELRIL